jgi:hypothetical protein
MLTGQPPKFHETRDILSVTVRITLAMRPSRSTAS